MEASDVFVYIADVKALEDRDFYRHAYETASGERREKADRYQSDQSRRLCLGAEVLLKRALADAGHAAEELSYGYGEHEKPYLSGMPGFHFNLSHSGDYVMLAAAECEVGCDIEKIKEGKLPLAKRFFCREEYELIAAAEAEERDLLFTRYWTLKESYIKMTGMGLACPLDSFQILLKDGQEPVCLTAEGERACRFAESGAIPGFRCAVCAEGSIRSFIWELTDLRKIEKNS